MVHDKGDNDIQVFRFVLLEVKLPMDISKQSP